MKKFIHDMPDRERFALETTFRSIAGHATEIADALAADELEALLKPFIAFNLIAPPSALQLLQAVSEAASRGPVDIPDTPQGAEAPRETDR